eukprot:CAMPEP_0201693742 /NCGR_PEP_ID=MMETSP0578-20130828/6225_1 /ASSEMBLY_ACC=CAM_ASM_000663 /TAXON_ID=267565 /ORGANISM="Skeletonema grethea, Strain CCMP 1804" /LENGTH=479 /DNA_ID=CAMNT_0048179313 /DNA_START=791 /DNA_END=2230 /DNA_ORIENTATION=+
MSSDNPPSPPPPVVAEGGGPSMPPQQPPPQQQQQSSNDAAITDTAAVSRPYVYRDFAQDDTDYGGDATMESSMHSASGGDGVRGLTNQKLPAKLNAMLSDPDLVTCITWMPHGRSWKILNRDVFSRYALPKYFGHTNHASFIRIVNAWGFRRVVTSGPDRDTYYHELFLRGKHNLHVKMKRLPTTHRKTPMDKNESSPNFYEMSDKSPLPENVWLPQAGVVSHRGGGSVAGGGGVGVGGPMGMMEGYGMMGSAAAANMGGGMMSGMNSRMQLMQQQQQHHQQQHHHPQQQHLMGHPMSGMMPGMGMMSAPFSYPSVNPAAAAAAGAGMGSVGSVAAGTSPSAASAAAATSMSATSGVHPLSDNDTLTQLQRENDTLMRQLLQLQSQMNPPNPNTTNNAEEGSAAAAITALQRDNERLIRQVMELQEQLPPELRMQIPMEMLMPQQHPSRLQQHQQQPQSQLQEEQKKKGKSEEKDRTEI